VATILTKSIFNKSIVTENRPVFLN